MAATDLAGRTALVTGGARSLGRAIALSIAESGAKLGVHYRRSATAASETADAAAERGSPAVATVEGDVTDPEAVEAVFDRLEAVLGPVEVLVTNVGDFAPRHWAEIDPETWDRVIETNLTATYLCARRALGPMREGGWGGRSSTSASPQATGG